MVHLLENDVENDVQSMGQFHCKLEQLFRESEGSFREVEGYFSTQTLGLYIYMYTWKEVLEFC